MGTVRIIGGMFGGRKLRFPDVDGLRPTSDRARETLFNWLQFQIAGKTCLDCYAGSGAIGLEALSRGAMSCDFIEANRKAADSIEKNIELLSIEANVYHMPFGRFCALAQNNYDIVFIDPPYRLNLWQDTISALFEHRLVHPKSLLYIEHDGSLAMTDIKPLAIFKERRIGHNTLLLTGLSKSL